MRQSYIDEGLEPPADIEKPPAIMPGAYLFWSAYSDLQHERPPALYIDGKAVPQRIPWSAIATYARHHRLNVDELKRVIWAMDEEIISGAPTPVAPIEENDDD